MTNSLIEQNNSKIINLEDQRDKRDLFEKSDKARRNFTIISQDLYQKSGLSLEAMGLISYLISLPDDWVVYVAHLRKTFKLGKNKVLAIMKELIRAGYMSRYPVRDAKGRIAGWKTRYSDSPEFLASRPELHFPALDNPALENPELVNQPLQSNNNTKELLNKNNNNNQESIINIRKSTNFSKEHEVPTDSVVVLIKRLQYLAISSVLIKSWLKKHGAAYVLEKVDLMESQKPQNPEGFLNKAIIQDWKPALTKEPENKKDPIEPSYPSHDENLAWYKSLSDADKLNYLQMALFRHPIFEEHLKYQKASVLDADFKSHSLFKMFMGLLGRGK